MKKGVQKIYHEVARTYELINHVLTFGLDSLWRKKAARFFPVLHEKLCLDICSGTGDMIKHLSKKKGEKSRIIAADFNLSMLELARKRYQGQAVSFCLCDAKDIPFGEDLFDLIVISFATRNINSNEPRLKRHFKEFNRILKPGGIFIHLESSQPQNRLIRFIFHFYARYIVKVLGTIISGSRSGYEYLSHTLVRFHDRATLTRILKESGFSRIESKKLFLGIAAIHISGKSKRN